jgi:ornithine cyclodeaminase/alanine dehydrogenase-like protein (mu-crystallin family)
MNREATLLLSRHEVARLLTMEECIAAVEHAFRLYGEKQAEPPGMLGLHGSHGTFHIKAGFLRLQRNYFAAKVNANYPENGERFGLPTIQGVVMLCDAENGRPLAMMDSAEITARRTAAATAVAAKYLAHPKSAVLTVCGCGVQGHAQVRALAVLLPLRTVFAYDTCQERAEQFAEQIGDELGIEVRAVADLKKALLESDVGVTCTTSRKPLLARDDVPPGIFLASVGADHPEKQELDPALMAACKVVADVAEQCAAIGDLHHAITAGAMQLSDVHAELGEIVAGRKPRRSSPEEMIIFDSTGMALQDVAAAAATYENALAAGWNSAVDFAA